MIIRGKSVVVAALILVAVLGWQHSVTPESASAGIAADDCPVIDGDALEFNWIGKVPQYVKVPAGVAMAAVEVRGGHGGQTPTTADGGEPGLVQGDLPVAAGDCLEIWVADAGGSSRWGFSEGGDRGTQWGAGRDAGNGAGASAIGFVGASPSVVAGGGGGGGGDGASGAYTNRGGAGGAGAGGDGPGTSRGGDGENGQGVPITFGLKLGGLGGWQSGNSGGGGMDGSVDPFSGAGGGGGGGLHGGSGGANWIGGKATNLFSAIGGGGAGGGNSGASSTVQGAKYMIAATSCGDDPNSTDCQGSVSIDWIEHPTNVTPYSGSNQSTPVTATFGSPLEAIVKAASGDPVPQETVTFNLPADGAGASFAVPGNPSSATAVTDAKGIAVSPPLAANGTAGGWTAQATIPSLRKAAMFPMSNTKAKTATALFASPTPSRGGEPVSITAVVGASPSSAGIPAGQVHFEVDGASVGKPVPVSDDGVAVLPPIDLKPGNHQLTAGFDGNGDFAASGAEITHQVDRGSVTVRLESTPNPAAEGSEVNFSARVSPSIATKDPGGSVQFSVDGENQGSVVELTAAGTADTSLEFDQAGPHVVRAIYGGDADFAPATGVLVQSVGDEASAVTVTSSSPSQTFGAQLTFKAIVAAPVPPDGVVTFTAAGQNVDEFKICESVTLTAGEAECEVDEPLASGEYEIEAQFDPVDLGVEPSQGRTAQLILPGSTLTEIEASPSPAAFSQPYGLEALVTPAPLVGVDPGGRVTFIVAGRRAGDPAALDNGHAVLSPSIAPALSGGPHPIGATYGGNPNFRSSTSASVLTVDPVETVTALTSPTNPSPHGRGVQVETVVSRVDGSPAPVNGSVQFWADGSVRGEPVDLDGGTAKAVIAGLPPGHHDLRVYFVASDDYQPSEAQLTQTVDSPPATADGILPCGPRRFMVTAVYRLGRTVRFEGVAVRSLRGHRVHILTGKRSVARATVRPDGTFWAAAALPKTRLWGATRYRAKINGGTSRSRKLRQPIEIVRRHPRGTKQFPGRARLLMKINAAGRRPLVLARQTACGPKGIDRLKGAGTSPDGSVRVALPRPRKGSGYGVYRLMTRNGQIRSTPIIVRERK